MWVVASVLVVPAPFIPQRGKLVGSQGAGTRGEAGERLDRVRERDVSESHNVPAGENDGLLSIPGLIVSHDPGMQSDIVRGELGQLVWLGVDPPQWLHLLREREREIMVCVCVSLKRSLP